MGERPRTYAALAMHFRRRRGISIEVLRAFVALSEHGSFSNAAEELNLTQPAISAQIKRLQRALGDDLIVKKATGLGLTDLGSVVEDYARRILTLTDQLVGAAGQTSRQETINVGIQSVFARLVLPEVKKIGQTSKALRYQFVCASAAVMAKRFKSGYVDLGFMLAPNESRRNMAVEWNEKLVWASAPDALPLSEDEPIPFIGRQDGFMDSKVFSVLDEREVPYRMVFNASDNLSMIAAVEAGIGFMILPERAMPHSLIVARDRHLPKLPELRAGVFYKEGFDLARHRRLVSAFVSAVRPPRGNHITMLTDVSVEIAPSHRSAKRHGATACRE